MVSTIKLTDAQYIVAAATVRANELDVPMNIAIVDAGANLVAFVRMDGAWIGSIEIAQNKAYSARAFDMSTMELAKISQPGEPAYGIASSTQHKIAIFPGGVPLKVDNQIIGAIGVSGGKPDQDHEVAMAGVAALIIDKQ